MAMRLHAGILASAGLLAAVACHGKTRMAPDAGATEAAAITPPSGARYVGSEACSGCHRSEYDRWKSSHHALAMQPANEKTVLGDFGGSTFELRGKRWRFFKEGDKFLVSAEGPDGRMHDYPVTHTFGWDPLQQYLVPFPGGRLQALSVAWDTRAHRWFFLYPDQDIPPSDWLHWSRPGQNWNAMCADCHSTNLTKGYDADADNFHTRYDEISVGCEACHGPGSLHASASAPGSRDAAAPKTALLTRTSGITNEQQVAQCAPCHSRRAQFADQGPPGGELLDRYLPALLSRGVFYPDGQIEAEDYEYHSFTQSKMYREGVRCTDCHDPHSGKRRAEGNALCTRCHEASKFDTTAHHHHPPGPGAQCVSCHMPGQNYMVVHFRRDHSLRVPRPDVSIAVGSPMACRQPGCHADRPDTWALQQFEQFWGKEHGPHYGPIIAAGLAAGPSAGRDTQAALAELATAPHFPVVARATALEILGGEESELATGTLEHALTDPQALIRHTAVARLQTRDAQGLVQRLAPLLSDPIRAVRTQAAARLAEAPPQLMTDAERAAFSKALDEFVQDQRYMSDLPSGAFNLGNLYASMGSPKEAEKQYRRALAVDDQLYAAKVNLAMLLAQHERQAEAEKLFREVQAAQPQLADVSFDLGLLLAEEGKRPAAEQALRAALKADPGHAAAAYNLAVMIGDRDPKEAIELLTPVVAARPGEERYARALAYFRSKVGESPTRPER
jgi:predicted CXXCH cytochrome family protein